MPRYILIYPSPPLIPADSDAIAERVLDPDDATAIASGDVTSAEWIVENPDGDAVRMTTGDLIAHVTGGSLSIPTFAVRTAYPRLGAFVFNSVLYRVLRAIPANNAGDVSTLLATGQVEALGGTGSEDFIIPTFAVNTAYALHSGFVDSGILYRVIVAIPSTNTSTITELLAANSIEVLAAPGTAVDFAILNWRGGPPRPPFKSQAEAFAKGLLTIGIDLDGVLWTLQDTPATDAEGTWIDFDNPNWEFEQNSRLPVAAINAGDFWYRYDEDVWEVYDGSAYTVYYDREISTFLPNHIFLGQFANAENATQSIVGYDGTKTYLAYFTVTEGGFTGRQVRQLQSYTPGAAESISWVSTNETLYHISAELHNLIQDNVTEIGKNKSLIGEEGVNIRNNARAISDLETEQDTQDTLIQRNADNIPEGVDDRDALRGVRADGYLTPRQVRIDSKATFTKEASEDPEVDTLHIRYAAVDYDATAYNADDLEFAQMMFNNATLASANRIKIGYINGRRIGNRLDTLVVGSKIQLLEVNTGPDYEEPNNVFQANITGIVRTVKTGLEDISTIELTLDANPTLSVGLGPNTQYFVAVSGRFNNRVVPVIQDADIGKVMGINASKEIVFVERTTAPASAARSEALYFNAQNNVGNTEVPIVHRSVDPIVVLHGDDVPNILRLVSGQTSQIEFLRRGIYDIHVDGLINADGTGNSLRVLPRIRFYDTNDNFVAEIDDHYHRVTNATSDNLRMSGDGTIRIPTDNFVVRMSAAQEITGGGTTFDFQANWNITVIPFGVQGPPGIQGPQGIQGPIGPTGLKGDKGDQGRGIPTITPADYGKIIGVDSAGDVIFIDPPAPKQGVRAQVLEILITPTQLNAASSNFNATGVEWDGANILVADNTSKGIFGFNLDGSRATTKDISSTVVRSASNFPVNIAGIAWDGASVLVADRDSDNIFAFTNGARASAKDIGASILRGRNPGVAPTDIAWDGASLLVLSATHDSVYVVTNGAIDRTKELSALVLRTIRQSVAPTGLGWDGTSVLVVDTSAIRGITNKVRDVSKDIDANTGVGTRNIINGVKQIAATEDVVYAIVTDLGIVSITYVEL